jgi:hypothetical protein
MKVGTILLVLFSLLAFSVSYDDAEHTRKRWNFYKDIEKYSNGTITVGVSKDEGLYCVANTDIQLGKKVIRVPIEKTLCPYYLFPFKFEIAQTLNTIPQLSQSVNTEQKFSVFLLTYYLLYIMRADKTLVREYIQRNNITEYFNSLEHDPSILDSFPKVILGASTLEPEQYAILKELGYPLQNEYELENVFRTVANSIVVSNHAEIIFPWISDMEEFKYAYGIIMSRGMTVKIQEYKLLMNITSSTKFSYIEQANYDLNMYFSKGAGASCLIPYIDLCNHHHPKFEDMRDKHPIILDTEPGFFTNTQPVDYFAGEEITFTYSNEPSNLILFFHYGFIIHNNIFNTFKIRIEDDFVFNVNQFNLCRELGCLDSTIKDPLKVPKIRGYSVRLKSVSNDVVMLGRIKYLKGESNYGKILKLLTNDKSISIENEIKAWAFYRSNFRLNQFSNVPLQSSIYNIQKFRNRRIAFEKSFHRDSQSDLKVWKSLKHKEIVYGIDLSYRGEVVYHQSISIRKVIKNLNLSINDLKNKKYLKNK